MAKTIKSLIKSWNDIHQDDPTIEPGDICPGDWVVILNTTLLSYVCVKTPKRYKYDNHKTYRRTKIGDIVQVSQIIDKLTLSFIARKENGERLENSPQYALVNDVTKVKEYNG